MDTPTPPATPSALLTRMGPPMLATRVEVAAPDVGAWVYEVKYDGFRALAAVAGGACALVSRAGHPLDARFPRVAASLSAVRVGEAVFDGEVVVLDEEGRSRFARLDQGLEATFVAFDLLWLEGRDLRALPLSERRARLEAVLRRAPPYVVLAERVPGPAAAALARARERGWEGVIGKRPDAPYTGGRSPAWVKRKLERRGAFTIVGFTPSRRVRRELGALLLGARGPGGLRFAGAVGTGFTDEERRVLWDALLERTTPRCPLAEPPPDVAGARWVVPELVARVGYTEWTEGGRLRHPRLLGLAPDSALAPVPAPRHDGSVRVTHPERLVYPAAGLTKADVVAYYRDVAPVLLPVLEDRPLTLQQWPGGVDAPGFYRQQLTGVPDWLRVETVRHRDGPKSHLLVDSEEALAWLANQSALTLHVWSARVDALEAPDWVVFDFDPPDGAGPAGWRAVLTLATTLRRVLEAANLRGVPKTSGKRGLHVLVPLARGPGHAQVTAWARGVMDVLARLHPTLATTERLKARREGRLYLDALQNGRGKTVVAPYSLRDTPQATVSTPLRWEEVAEGLDPTRFTLRLVRRRLDALGDLFRPVLQGRQELPYLPPPEPPH